MDAIPERDPERDQETMSQRVIVLMGISLYSAVANDAEDKGVSVGGWMRRAARRQLNAGQAAQLDAAHDA